MSRHGTTSPVASALDLHHTHSRSAQDTSEDSETDMAGSVMAPWSQYNTRTAPNHTLPYAPSVLEPHLPFIPTEPTPNGTQAYSNLFSLLEPISRCTSPDATTLLSSSPSPSPPSSRLGAAASSAATYSTLPNTGHGESNTIFCEECSKGFTGLYRRGNLKRHVRQKHTEAKGGTYTCLAKGCFGVFQRPDARLKHARNRHPELNLPPIQRRHGTEHDVTNSHISMIEDIDVAQEPPFNVGQWLQAGQISIGSHATKVRLDSSQSAGVGELPRAAQCVFTTLWQNLHPGDYSHACDSFFTRWERIVQQLNDEQSNAYPLYAKVLDDVRLVVRTMDIAVYDMYTAGSRNYRKQAPPNQRSNLLSIGRPSQDYTTSNTSHTERVSEHERKQSLASTSGGKALVALEEFSNHKGTRTVDCPVFKHHLMHDTVPPCQGCSKSVMSQVRSHLNPDRAGTHCGFPSFVQQCQRCKQDFVEEHVYNAHNREGCVPQPQIRNDIIVSWARQHLALYPNSLNIPIPWTDVEGWLTETETRRCCAPLANSAVSSPFLGDRQGQHSSRSQTTPAPTNSPDDLGYDCVLNHVLHDVMVPSFIQAKDSSTSMQYHDYHSPTNLLLPFSRVLDPSSQAWQDILLSFQAHEQTIREAATYLTSDQLQYMVREAGEVYNISRGMYHWYASHQAQVQVHPTFAYVDSSMDFTTPLRSQYLANRSNGHCTAPDASKRPSSGGHHTGSSIHIDPILTQPSSTSDPRLLTLDSSNGHHHRRTSVLSPMQDTQHLRQEYSRRSQPDESSTHGSDTCLHNPMRYLSRRYL